jgi:thiamine biosynthesis protein ThiS
MEGSRIKIVLNGRPREVDVGTTVSGLLRELSLPETRVAVERNEEILRKPAFDATELAAGDRLEIVTLVGGG